MSNYVKFTLFAVGLAYVVVLLGAYTRLADAGLGCPDWPGCYGHMGVPDEHLEIHSANEAYPERPVEAPKAWKEMVHRYFAGTLGLVILGLAITAWRRRTLPGQQVLLPGALLVLVVFQALLGMWTVTLLLKPVVVMAHLLGGLTTLALLWWLALRQGGLGRGHPQLASLRPWALLGLVIVYLQISLGGWTSTNYAALACPDFPTCQAQWWPETDFSEAFVMWRGLGVNYEFGVLEGPARVAIHLSHRIGAVVTLLYLGWLAITGIRRGIGLSAYTVLGLLIVQVLLGIANVVMALPLGIAVAHNGVAALLLLAVVSLNHVLNPPNVEASHEH